MPTTKKKGPRWRLTGNYHQVAEQIILAPYPEIIPCHGSAFPRQSGINCCYDILAVLFSGRLIYAEENSFREPTTINQTFKSTDKEKERQWDKITSVPWEKGGIQRFYSRSLKVYFLRQRNDSTLKMEKQVNEGRSFSCASCLPRCTSRGLKRNLVRILLYCIMNDEGKCLAHAHLRSDERVFRQNGSINSWRGTKIGIENLNAHGAIGKF